MVTATSHGDVLRDLVRQLAFPQLRDEAIVNLVGGLTATELRRIGRS